MSRTRAIQLLVAAMVVALPIALQVSAAVLPRWARFAVMEVWAVVAVFLIVIIISSRLREWRDRPAPFKRRPMLIIALIGAVIGFVVAPFVWAIIPPDEVAPPAAQLPNGAANQKEKEPKAPVVNNPDDPTAMVMRRGETAAVLVSLPPNSNLKPANPDDLQLYFFAPWCISAEDNLQYADATITNRSPQRMHLEIWGHWDYWKDSGELARTGLKAEWNPDGVKEHTGETFINLDAWETKRGRVVLFIGKPSKGEIGTWFIDGAENVYFEFFDTVSAKKIAFKAFRGYPSGQMPTPLPHRNTLHAAVSPVVGASSEQESAAPKLDVIVRTRNRLHEGTKWNVSVLVTNLSAKPMEIGGRLMVRGKGSEDSPADLAGKEVWAAVDGIFREPRETKINVGLQPKFPPVPRLAVDQRATRVSDLEFEVAAIGTADDGKWRLTDNPQETLLEITDHLSGKKVWCGLRAGYPPGTDMRGAIIADFTTEDSANSQADEPNDTK
jgi:hypothetical protein